LYFVNRQSLIVNRVFFIHDLRFAINGFFVSAVRTHGINASGCISIRIYPSRKSDLTIASLVFLGSGFLKFAIFSLEIFLFNRKPQI